jgi:poly(A) polymerase
VTTAVSERLVPRVLARPEHRLSRRDISTDALKVLYRLHRSGYLAYLVGGGVRDLLLGNTPKDFDVATNARPQEIRRLFRNSRIIGRRFRLVHIFFRNETVEVATFRASPDPPEGPDEWEEAEQEEIEADSDERPVSAPMPDATYGSPAEDARRRDFTVNALFYSVADFTIIDYVGGIEDLEVARIRTIGDPELRFREDPVRMMRALEYGVRLDFELEEQTREAIESCRHLIKEASPARLSYELMESLRSGSAAGICRAWRRAGIFDAAFPELPGEGRAAEDILRVVDERVAAGAVFPDATLVGSFFLPAFHELLKSTAGDDGQRLDNARFLLDLRQLIEPSAAAMHLSNHTVHLLYHGLFTLTKMRRPPERGRQVLKLTRQDFFPVAWDLFQLSAATELVAGDVLRGWSAAVGRVRRGQPVEEPPSERRPARRPRRRRRGRGRRK